MPRGKWRGVKSNKIANWVMPHYKWCGNPSQTPRPIKIRHVDMWHVMANQRRSCHCLNLIGRSTGQGPSGFLGGYSTPYLYKGVKSLIWGGRNQKQESITRSKKELVDQSKRFLQKLQTLKHFSTSSRDQDEDSRSSFKPLNPSTSSRSRPSSR